jgi:hypothetical protein
LRLEAAYRLLEKRTRNQIGDPNPGETQQRHVERDGSSPNLMIPKSMSMCPSERVKPSSATPSLPKRNAPPAFIKAAAQAPADQHCGTITPAMP